MSLIPEFHSSGDSHQTSDVSHFQEGSATNSIHQESNWIAQYDPFFAEEDQQRNLLPQSGENAFEPFKNNLGYIEMNQGLLSEDAYIQSANKLQHVGVAPIPMYYSLYGNNLLHQNIIHPGIIPQDFNVYHRLGNIRFKANTQDMHMDGQKNFKFPIKEPDFETSMDMLNEDTSSIIERYHDISKTDADSVEGLYSNGDNYDSFSDLKSQDQKRNKQKRKQEKKVPSRASKSSKGNYNNHIEHDFLEKSVFQKASFDVKVKPARRLNTEYASKFPSEMCSKPYKYLLAIRSEKKSRFKFFLTIQKKKDSDEYIQLDPVEHSSASGVQVQRIKQKEASNGDDIQYFYIKFLETSFKNTKKMFRLNVVDEGRYRFESNPVKLVARRSKKDNQDLFWSNNERPPNSNKSRKSRMDLNEEESFSQELGSDELEDDLDWMPEDCDSPTLKKRKRSIFDEQQEKKRKR